MYVGPLACPQGSCSPKLNSAAVLPQCPCFSMNNETEIQFSNSKTPGGWRHCRDCDLVTVIVTVAIVIDSKLLPHRAAFTHTSPLSLEGKDVMKMFTLRCHTTRPSHFSACHRIAPHNLVTERATLATVPHTQQFCKRSRNPVESGMDFTNESNGFFCFDRLGARHPTGQRNFT